MTEIKKSKKDIELEVKKRIDYCLDLLKKDIETKQIINDCTKEFKVTDKQANTYTIEANKLLGKNKKDLNKQIIDKRVNKKANEMESNKRVIKIMQMLLDCDPRHAIIQYCTKKWKLEESQIDKYISKAKKRIVQTVRKEEKTAYEDAIARRKNLFNKAIKKKSYKTALYIDDSRAKLQGLFTENIKISGDKENPVEVAISNMTDEQLKKVKETQELVKNTGSEK